MAQGTTPVVAQRRLRAELRKAREDAGHTQKKVAEQLGWSLSKVIRLETGATSVSTSDAMALIHYYEITDRERIDDLLSVTRARERAWWDEYSELYTQQFLNFLAYEDSASRIRQFQTLGVPGLLQTASYAREVFQAYLSEEARIERAVKVRLRRQGLLTLPNGPEMIFVVDEAVIHRQVGGPEVMIEQLARLKAVNDLDNPSIIVRVVPFSAGVNRGMKGSFVVMDFPADEDESIVNVEEPNSDVLIRDNPETTSKYVEAFLALEELALSKAKSTELIESVINNMSASLQK